MGTRRWCYFFASNASLDRFINGKCLSKTSRYGLAYRGRTPTPRRHEPTRCMHRKSPPPWLIGSTFLQNRIQTLHDRIQKRYIVLEPLAKPSTNVERVSLHFTTARSEIQAQDNFKFEHFSVKWMNCKQSKHYRCGKNLYHTKYNDTVRDGSEV